MTTLVIISILLGIIGIAGTTLFLGLWLASEWKLYKKHNDSTVFIARSDNAGTKNEIQK